MSNDYDVVILGAGAAGLSAGLYSTRAMLSTLMIESIGPGGQLLITDEIENYPGFREGVKGQALADEMYNQAERFGAKTEFAEIEGVENLYEDRKLVRTSEGEFHRARADHRDRRFAQQAGCPRRGRVRRARGFLLRGL